MKRLLTSLMLLCALLCLSSCTHIAEKKLNRQMKALAETYLNTNGVAFQSIAIESVDTVTEMGYANMNRELLSQMEEAYQNQYNNAVGEGDSSAHYIRLYLNEIYRIREDFEDLMASGSLKSEGALLYMVSGNYKTSSKDEVGEPFIFMVKPDKKTIHILDPFGDNLLYQDEEAQ